MTAAVTPASPSPTPTERTPAMSNPFDFLTPSGQVAMMVEHIMDYTALGTRDEDNETVGNIPQRYDYLDPARDPYNRLMAHGLVDLFGYDQVLPLDFLHGRFHMHVAAADLYVTVEREDNPHDDDGYGPEFRLAATHDRARAVSWALGDLSSQPEDALSEVWPRGPRWAARFLVSLVIWCMEHKAVPDGWPVHTREGFELAGCRRG